MWVHFKEFFTPRLRFFLFCCLAGSSTQSTSTCVVAKLDTKYFSLIFCKRENMFKLTTSKDGTVMKYTQQGRNESTRRLPKFIEKNPGKKLECYIRCLRRRVFFYSTLLVFFLVLLCLHILRVHFYMVVFFVVLHDFCFFLDLLPWLRFVLEAI